MAVTHYAKVMIGTSESVGDTIANNTTDTGVEQDMLGTTQGGTGDDASFAFAHFFLVFTSTVTVGSVDVNIIAERISGQSSVDVPMRTVSVTPANATKKCFLCTLPVSRFMLVTVKNNATGANITNVFVGSEIFKIV